MLSIVSETSRAAPSSQTQANPKATKRITINFQGKDLENLEWLAQHQNISLADAVRKALNTDAFVRKTLAEGSEILIKESPDDIYKLLLH